jgi:hypothetical protein
MRWSRRGNSEKTCNIGSTQPRRRTGLTPSFDPIQPHFSIYEGRIGRKLSDQIHHYFTTKRDNMLQGALYFWQKHKS